MQEFRQEEPAEVQPETPNAPIARRWAIRRWCLVLSLVLAGVAEVLLVIAGAIAFFRGSDAVDVVVSFALALGWTLFYGATYLLANGIALIDQAGSVTEQFPRWYQTLFSASERRALDAWYRLMPNFFLIAIPAVAVFMALVLAWISATGQPRH